MLFNIAGMDPIAQHSFCVHGMIGCKGCVQSCIVTLVEKTEYLVDGVQFTIFSVHS